MTTNTIRRLREYCTTLWTHHNQILHDNAALASANHLNERIYNLTDQQLHERPLTQALGMTATSKKHLHRLLALALQRAKEQRHTQQSSMNYHFRRLTID